MKSEMVRQILLGIAIVMNLTMVTVKHRWSADMVMMITTGVCIGLLIVTPLLNSNRKAIEDYQEIVRTQRKTIDRLEAHLIKSTFSKDSTGGLN